MSPLELTSSAPADFMPVAGCNESGIPTPLELRGDFGGWFGHRKFLTLAASSILYSTSVLVQLADEIRKIRSTAIEAQEVHLLTGLASRRLRRWDHGYGWSRFDGRLWHLLVSAARRDDGLGGVKLS